MKKRLTVLLMVGAMTVATMSGCGQGSSASASAESSVQSVGQESKTSDSTQETAGDGSYEIVLLPSCTGNAWWDTSGAALESWCEKNGHKGYYVGSTNYDAAEQLSILQDEIAQKPDAILLQPVSNESVSDACQQARDEGIVVITHEALGLVTNDYELNEFVLDEYCGHLVELMVEHMGEEGQWVFMVPTLENSTWVSYATGSVDYAKENYPELEAIADVIGAGGSDYDSAYNTTKELLTKNPQLKGIISNGQSAAVGAAVADMGLTGKVTVIGSGCMPSENGEAIANGSVQVICLPNPMDMTEAMASLAVKILNGETVEDGVDLGVEGYRNCKLTGNEIRGNSFFDVDTSNIDEWKEVL